MKILVVEDDKDIARVLGIGLRNERMVVDHAPTAASAINMAIASNYDVILLDLMLPDRDGNEVCRILRNAKINSAIIALTALGDLQSKVRLFGTGVDDYIVKPFDFEELFARIKSAMRKYSVNPENNLQFDDLRLDTKRHEVYRNGKQIELRDKEMKILEYMMRHPEQVLTREMILNYVWGPNTERYTNVVDVHVHNLREKIDKPFQRKNLKTVNNVGYKITKNQAK